MLVEDNKFLSPAIEEAIRCRNLEKLKFLRQNGYSLEGSCYCGCSPLLVALTVAGKEISHFIVEAGASLGGVVVSHSMAYCCVRILFTTCGHNHACDLSVSAGASVLSRDHEGLSPIHCAI